MRYRESDRNQLANCMLLTAAENGAGGKSDTPPDEWFKDKDAAYLGRHLIPPDPALWKLDRFEDFIAERKKLINPRSRYTGAVVFRSGLCGGTPPILFMISRRKIPNHTVNSVHGLRVLSLNEYHGSNARSGQSLLVFRSSPFSRSSFLFNLTKALGAAMIYYDL